MKVHILKKYANFTSSRLISFLAVAEEWKTCIFKNQDKMYRFVEELIKKKIIGEVERSNLKNIGSGLGIVSRA